MKKNFTIHFLFHLFFLLLVIFLVLIVQSVAAQPRFTVTIAPNPVYSSMSITASGGTVNETLRVQLYSKGGDLVYDGSMRVTGSTTVKKIHKPTAPPGLYYYRVTREKTGEVAEGKIAFQ